MIVHHHYYYYYYYSFALHFSSNGSMGIMYTVYNQPNSQDDLCNLVKGFPSLFDPVHPKGFCFCVFILVWFVFICLIILFISFLVRDNHCQVCPVFLTGGLSIHTMNIFSVSLILYRRCTRRAWFLFQQLNKFALWVKISLRWSPL